MTRNTWTQDRTELLEMAATFVDRRWPAASVAESMIERHYTGCSKAQAQRQFQADLEALVARRNYEMFCQRAGEVNAMAATLEAEGWRYLTVPGRNEGFWYHDRLGSINQNGGGFESFTIATERAYNSAIRSYFNK